MSSPFVSAGVVVLTDRWLAAALQAVRIAARQRALNGVSAAADYGALAEAFTSALAASGRETSASEPEWLSTRQAAVILGCSERSARRIATQVGRRVGRQWLIPANALPK